MATNPTTLVPTDKAPAYPALVKAANTDSSITLEPDRRYKLYHTGLNESGTAQAENIFFANNTAAVASFAVATNKWALVSGKTDGIEIGPGITTLHFITTANAPVFVIAPEIRLWGNW
jgi:hypothetical protein